ncbi:MAG: DUF3618 domain-containing protein [Sphingomonas bacterium]|nr:DUF3618 domain-containing protein [Sphingomonas bacterium]
MTDTAPEHATVTAARIEVERRRGAMLDTIHLLQARLAPRTLAADAWEKAKNKGADLAEEAVDAVKARPVAVGGIAAALAMFLAREPIRDAAVKIYDAMTAKKDTKKARPALNPPHPPVTPAPRRARAKRASAKTETVS